MRETEWNSCDKQRHNHLWRVPQRNLEIMHHDFKYSDFERMLTYFSIIL